MLAIVVTGAVAEDSPTTEHSAHEVEMRESIKQHLPKTDSDLPDYNPVGMLDRQISIIGDDLNFSIALVAERFRRHHPAVQFTIAGGRNTAPPFLITNTISFGGMTRKFNDRELAAFVDKFGYEPTYLLLTWDVQSVWVHKDNPIETLTLAQLDAIFSAERRRGHPEAIATWGQLGLDGEWGDRAITVHGRNSESQTFHSFVRTALEGALPQEGCIAHLDSSKVVEAVAADPAAVGFTGSGYGSEGVRAVPIVTDPAGPAVAPSLAAASEGRYPLGGPFYLVINHKPGDPLDPLRAEFLRFLYSRQGQVMIAIDRYPPLPAEVAKRQLQQVGLEP